MLLQACTVVPGMKMAHHDGDQWFPGQAVRYREQTLQIQPVSLDLIDRLESRREQEAAEVAAEFGPVHTPYRIGPTDILQITVWDHPELTIPAGAFRDAQDQGQLVSEDGNLYYPYAGVMQVAGMTVGEVRELLTRRLSRYIKNPQLDVRVVGFRSKKVYVVGEVRQPGVLELTDVPMTVADAINKSGGLTPEAHKGGLNLSRDGQVHKINLRALYDLADASQNLTLRDGDIVNVPDRSQQKVFVMGEVKTPGNVDIVNDRLSLAAALGEVGGVNQNTANPARIYVVRGSDGTRPEIFHLDARYAYGMLLAERFEMQAQDVVFVDSAAVSSWNRVISQLLPSAQLVTIGVR